MPVSPRRGRPSRPRRVLGAIVIAVGVYLALAFLVLPAFWRHYEHLPAMQTLPKYTRTTSGLQGDALNVGLIGTQAHVERALLAAGWRPAVALGLESDLGIAASVLLDRPDPTAPVSTLLLWGRKQDLAFEQQVGTSARQRNHVRFWRSELSAEGGRPVWVGAATRDQGVEFSRTAQITHRIAPDIDEERDTLVDDLEAAGQVTRIFAVTGIGPTLDGRNGGGDRYYTDGELYVAVLAIDESPGLRAKRDSSPPLVVLKDGIWSWLAPALSGDGAAQAVPTSTR
jgi:hypothetical protein